MHRCLAINVNWSRCIATVLLTWIPLSIWATWYGLNSDRDDIPPLLTQVLPAGACTCQTSTNFLCQTCLTYPSELLETNSSRQADFQYATTDLNNLGFNSGQCNEAFPGLFEDVLRATNFWKTQGRDQLDSALDRVIINPGMTRAAIINSNLYVISTYSHSEDHRRKMLAIISSIHQSLSANPERSALPDFEFIFSIEDRVDDVAQRNDPIWALARKPSEEAAWLMPDFGLWSWENSANSIGPYSQIVDSIVYREQHDDDTWADKKQQLVWRGKLSFAPKLRRALLEATRDASWADVDALDWNKKDNFLSMQDHCEYMFIAHIEGRAYSASLKYRQACRSVIVAHKLQYIQHHHYLMVRDGPNQNFVQVERDFSDLSGKIGWLLKNPQVAKQIADNSVKVFRERYLTPAATACYWRTLFTNYASVVSNNGSSEIEANRGMRYESFILMGEAFQMKFGV